MRWTIWLLAIVAFIAAALAGIGFFLLPNGLDVSRSVLINRPRATVYAQLADLNILRGWTPYYEMDSDAGWVIDGEAGPGQTMAWQSQTGQIGTGSVSILRTEAPERVDLLLRFGARVSFDSHILVRPAESGANVTWVVQGACRPDPLIVVPCRYMNFILRRSIARDLDEALTELKRKVEELPETDFEGLRPDFVTLEERPFVYVEATIVKPSPTAADMRAAEAQGVAQLSAFLAQVQPAVATAGPLHRFTSLWDPAQGRYVFRLGYPFNGPAPLTLVGVQVGRTPSGPAMRVLHVGPRAEMRTTYERAYAYLEAHHIALRGDGLPWEVLLRTEGAPDAATEAAASAPAAASADAPVRVEIYYPIEE